MGAGKRGSGNPQFAGGTLIDAVEALDGFDANAQGSANSQVEYRSYAGGGWTVHAGMMTVVTGAPTLTAEAATGRMLVVYTSGAARIVMVGGNATFKMPLPQRFQDANSIPEAMLRPYRRYTWTVPARITVDGTAVVEAGMVTSNGMLTLLAADPGAIWSSTAGGNWLPRYRRVAAGAIVDGPSSGIDPTPWHLLGIRYTEGLTPRIEWLIDGATLHTVSGDANMPVYPSATVGFYPGIGVGTPAGTTLQRSMARFVVEEV